MNTMIKFKLFLLNFLFVFFTFSRLHAGAYSWEKQKNWKNATIYTKTLIMNQKHPRASDKNPGTEDAPLKTINAAAQLVQPGERVLVHGGIYREMIQISREGEGPDNMISFEAIPGEEVIVRGSRVVTSPWIQKMQYTDNIEKSTLMLTWSKKIWRTTLPDSLFDNDYNPFALHNVSASEFDLMPWAVPVKSLSPFILTRGMVFHNGIRMVQLNNYGDLARVSGSFWVDIDGKTIHIHPYGSIKPGDKDVFEVAVQSHLLKPQSIGLGYINISGFIFEHCANGFLRGSTGAVNAMGGHHWIFENNVIREINSSGLEFGYRAFEKNDPRPENITRTDPDQGNIMVRKNIISDCGTAGIRSLTVTNAIVEFNEIFNCGWQDAENYWECGGIKLLGATNSLIANNHIHHIYGGTGIWLDWSNKFSRVTANIIHDVQTVQGGIFIEASREKNLVDNNVIWNIDGNGIYANDTDNQLFINNFIGRVSGAAIHMIVATDRELNGVPLTCENNQVLNTIFYDCNILHTVSSTSNIFDNNVYFTRDGQDVEKLNQWKSLGYDKNSQGMMATCDFNPDRLLFRWESVYFINPVKTKEEVITDFFKKERAVDFSLPGPFNNLNNDKEIFLSF